jgi:hypothetical protein
MQREHNVYSVLHNAWLDIVDRGVLGILTVTHCFTR